MDFKTAISKNLITDYKIFLPIFDDINSNQVLDDIKQELDITDNDIEHSKKSCFLYEGIKRFGQIKCIVYCKDTNDLHKMMYVFNNLNTYYNYTYYANYITCDINKKKRTKILDEFKNYNGISILFSVRILDECIDIPQCNSIYITYNSKSKIKTIQRICRAMRKTNDSTKIANLFIWSENDINDCIDIISSIKEIDNVSFVDKINLLKVSNTFIPREIENKINQDKLPIIKKLAIGIQEYRSQNWYENLNTVKEYMDLNDKLPSSKSNNCKIKRMGIWCTTQRSNYKNNKHTMKNEEIKRSWEEFIKDEKYKHYFKTNEELWHENLNTVKEYMDLNETLPSKTSKDNKIKTLGMWYSRQDQNYKNNKQIMKNEDIKRSWEDFIKDEKYKHYFKTNEELWHENLNTVKEYMDLNETLPSKTSKDNKIKTLGMWYSRQDQNYKNNKQIMKNEDIKRSWEDFIKDEKYKEYFKKNKSS